MATLKVSNYIEWNNSVWRDKLVFDILALQLVKFLFDVEYYNMLTLVFRN